MFLYRVFLLSATSHTKPTTTDIFRDICGAQDSNKRNILQFCKTIGVNYFILFVDSLLLDGLSRLTLNLYGMTSKFSPFTYLQFLTYIDQYPYPHLHL